MKKVVITGVSTGIGYSSAKILCDSGYFVYGSVRKNEDGKRLTSELGDNFQSLVFDVTDSKAKELLIEKDQFLLCLHLKSIIWQQKLSTVDLQRKLSFQETGTGFGQNFILTKNIMVCSKQ